MSARPAARARVARTSIAAMTTRCISPPDRVPGSRFARWEMSSAARAPATPSWILPRGQPRLAGANATSCATVSAMPESCVAGDGSTSATRPPSAAAEDGVAGSSPSVQHGAGPLAAGVTRGQPRGDEQSGAGAGPQRPREPGDRPAIGTQRALPERRSGGAGIGEADVLELERTHENTRQHTIAAAARPAIQRTARSASGIARRVERRPPRHPAGAPRFQREAPLVHLRQRPEQEGEGDRDEGAYPAERIPPEPESAASLRLENGGGARPEAGKRQQRGHHEVRKREGPPPRRHRVHESRRGERGVQREGGGGDRAEPARLGGGQRHAVARERHARHDDPVAFAEDAVQQEEEEPEWRERHQRAQRGATCARRRAPRGRWRRRGRRP